MDKTISDQMRNILIIWDSTYRVLSKREKDEIEFNASLDDNLGNHFYMVSKPVVEKIDISERIKFVVNGKKMMIKTGKK